MADDEPREVLRSSAYPAVTVSSAYPAVAVSSAAVLILQIALNRVFSFTT